jgi:putative colanic acid biosynthesis glycosyltransferase
MISMGHTQLMEGGLVSDIKILHLNIRASQGGAGRMALDLHRRLCAFNVDSKLIYGYGSGIVEDPSVANDKGVKAIGTKFTVIANYLTHRLVGVDILTGNAGTVRHAVQDCDIVHLHVPHHYYLNFDWLMELVRTSGKSLIVTAHDWWFLTGRCAFVEQCTGWRRSCGECGDMRFRDLPSFFDLSRRHRRHKLAAMEAIRERTLIVCPSSHLAENYRTVFRQTPIRVIPNSIDAEFEKVLPDVTMDVSERKWFVLSAADLSAPGKIDADLVHELGRLTDIEVQLVGRNNPFHYFQFKVMGEVRDRGTMAELLSNAKALIFCSRMDNAPLTIAEALCAGCFVLAYDSPAASEMLGQVGGRCIPTREEMIRVIRSGEVAALYGGINSAELVRRARAVYSGNAITNAYLAVYEEMRRV